MKPPSLEIASHRAEDPVLAARGPRYPTSQISPIRRSVTPTSATEVRMVNRSVSGTRIRSMKTISVFQGQRQEEQGTPQEEPGPAAAESAEEEDAAGEGRGRAQEVDESCHFRPPS